MPQRGRGLRQDDETKLQVIAMHNFLSHPKDALFEARGEFLDSHSAMFPEIITSVSKRISLISQLPNC